MRLSFDIETDGLLDQLTMVHSLCIQDVDGLYIVSCHDHHHSHKVVGPGGVHENHVEYGLSLLQQADEVIGHNIIGFDIPALQKVYPWFSLKPTCRITDTLVLSYLIYPDLKDRDFAQIKKERGRGVFPKQMAGRHGLEAWGHRIGKWKGDYSKEMKKRGLDPWAQWNQEMQDYCEQDVIVTTELYKKLWTQVGSDQSVQLEHDFAILIKQHQEQTGFWFNEEKAQRLYIELCTERQRIDMELRKRFEPMWVPKQHVVPKASREVKLNEFPNITRRRFSEKTKKELKPYVGPPKQGYMEGCPYTQLDYREFSPGSRGQVAERLVMEYGWEPEEWTKDNVPKRLAAMAWDACPKVDDETLATLMEHPEVKDLRRYYLIAKRCAALGEGRQGWLKLVRNGVIYGQVTTNGAVSGRCLHNSPNVTQTPSVHLDKKTKAPLLGEAGEWGWECRELWTPPPKGAVIQWRGKQYSIDHDWIQVGADASGLELRMLGAFLAPFDGGAYVEVVLNGDIHTHNQGLAGLHLRASAKTLIYALIYGAGDVKLGTIVLDDLMRAGMKRPKKSLKSLGAAVRRRFMDNLPALKKLQLAVKAKAKKFGYIRGLDKRKLRIRKMHASLNLLLQSAGALVMKQAAVFFMQHVSAHGYRYAHDWVKLANVHDEAQCGARNHAIATHLGELFVQSIREAGEHFKLSCPLDGEFKVGSSWAECH